MASIMSASVDSLTQGRFYEDPGSTTMESMGDVESHVKPQKTLTDQLSDTEKPERMPQSPDTVTSEGMRYSDFTESLQSNILDTIRIYRLLIDLQLVSTVEATKQIFPYLIKSRGVLREDVYKSLIDLKEPDVILNVALDEYDKFGNAERLALAGSLLAEIGAQSFPSLLALARSGRPECDFFTHVIANLNGVGMDDRLAALTLFADNPHPDVRLSLLEALHGLPCQRILPLLQRMSTDEDESIADEARTYCESFEV